MDQGAYWNRIREHYARYSQAIQQAGRNDWGVDRYAWDYMAGIRMTPIEALLWQDICAESLVLYPQYPVAGHFVDFGNPVAQIAIECDGAAFHTDRSRDERRQERIEGSGWIVYRITGSDCVKTDQYSGGTDGEPQRIDFNPARVLLRRIGLEHRIVW